MAQHIGLSTNIATSDIEKCQEQIIDSIMQGLKFRMESLILISKAIEVQILQKEDNVNPKKVFDSLLQVDTILSTLDSQNTQPLNKYLSPFILRVLTESKNHIKNLENEKLDVKKLLTLDTITNHHSLMGEDDVTKKRSSNYLNDLNSHTQTLFSKNKRHKQTSETAENSDADNSMACQ